MLTLISWNINGIRAAIRKGLWEKLELINPDVICFQETKADVAVMESLGNKHLTWKPLFHSATMKKGYSGVATYTKNTFNKNIFNQAIGDVPTTFETTLVQIGVGEEKFDVEGRLVITKHTLKKPKTQIKDFVVINGYYPQGGRGQDRINYKIEFYREVHRLANSLRNEGENIMLCGDFNTTVQDIDLARPAQNRKNTGCLPEEREALDWFLKDGYVDTFRYYYPHKEGVYSYWDQITKARERNVGWRIDYWIVDQKLLPYVKDSFVLTEVMGSDHAPAGIYLNV